MDDVVAVVASSGTAVIVESGWIVPLGCARVGLKGGLADADEGTDI